MLLVCGMPIIQNEGPLMVEGIYVCPTCHGRLNEKESSLFCSSCRATYRIHDGIPSFCDPAEDHTFDKESFMIFEDCIKYGHFWFKGRSRIIDQILLKHRPQSGSRLLEIGCGAGQNLVPIVGKGYKLFGIDVSLSALQYGHRSLNVPFQPAHAAGELLPYADSTFSCVLLLDVIEHLEDEVPLMREARRVLKPNGVIIVFSPGAPELFSAFDRHYGHHRRYKPSQIKAIFGQAGIVPKFISYAMFPVWLPAILKRKLFMSDQAPDSPNEYFSINPFVNFIFNSLLKLEKQFLAAGLRIPKGTSVIGVGIKV